MTHWAVLELGELGIANHPRVKVAENADWNLGRDVV